MFKALSRFLDSNEKEVQKYQPLIDAINGHEPAIKKLSDAKLKAKTQEFKLRLERGETLDDILPEAFAVVREATHRTTGMRHYDVQLIAGIVLHQGSIAEQRTGEGKTLSATTAAYLNALTGRGVHVVTVNDYLARRDAEWMGPIYHMLGISVGIINHEKSYVYDPNPRTENPDEEQEVHLDEDTALRPEEGGLGTGRYIRGVTRKEAYAADITYGTNNEFGFDYLRDNLVQDLSQMVQRGHSYAIVDEVDSILIDEARTPLIISAPDTEPTQKYYEAAALVNRLKPEKDYTIDEKIKSATLTEEGIANVEKMLGVENLYEKDFDTIHHIENALKAKAIYLRDKDYVVKDGEVIIVDEFTGRLMFGRRWSDGLHQAVEAKENVEVKHESKTQATITFQNLFRMYEKLSGMTGTAVTEAEEFFKIYKLDVVVIPTNKPMVRQDHSDVVYKTEKAKFNAVVQLVAEVHKKGQPILLGTTSVEKNERLSELLTKKKIPHNALNAKNHEKEAQIIAEGGKHGAITLATNIAGRGVDIKLDDKAREAGGLYVIGTERHESRRIDNQLRGRSGRQGDPGETKFFVSLEDDIMRIFGGEQVSRLMTMFKLPEDQPLEAKMVSKAIEQAQIKVETHNFDARKHVVEYDDVMNKQREVIYALRRKILEATQQKEQVDGSDVVQESTLQQDILAMLEKEIRLVVSTSAHAENSSEINYDQIVQEFLMIIPFDEQSQKAIIEEMKKEGNTEKIADALISLAKNVYQTREQQVGDQLAREIEKFVYLSVMDNLWVNHLDALDNLREGIGLRGYGQRDPLVEYKSEAYSMFERLLAQIDFEVTRRIFRVQIQSPDQLPQQRQAVANPQKVGRNDPCPCGSGKKFKKCHINREPQTAQEREAYNLYETNRDEWNRRFGKK